MAPGSLEPDLSAGETSPLLQNAPRTSRDGDARSKNVVDFDPNGDPENPRDWPSTYKRGIVALLALTAFTVTFTCISAVPVASHIVADLDGRASKSSSVLLVTIWELGEAAGPLVIAPLSEVFGRYPVMNGANVLFIGATVLAARSWDSSILIFARFLTGLAVASNVLNPAIVGDMFVAEQRGSAMSLIMLAPLVGGAVGPALAGVIAETLGWRAVLWISASIAGFCELVFLTCFRETFPLRILERRAARRRRRREAAPDACRPVRAPGRAERSSVWEAVMRPAVVLAGSGVLQATSLFGSVSFAYFYVMSTTLPDILEGLYGLSPSVSGAAFMAFSVGSIVGVALCNRLLDRISLRARATHGTGAAGNPEDRLPLAILGAVLLPLSVAFYGWTAQARLPLAVMLAAVAAIGACLMLSFLPLMAYVVDAFGLYSASAMTALIVTRCLMGTFLPLATAPLVGRLGYGRAFTVLAAWSASLAPIPVLVMRHGSRWRRSSEYTRE